MSDHSETAANTPSSEQLCKMGCGFFGSNATGDLCSKCWREKLEREGKAAAQESQSPSSAPASVPSPMDTTASETPAPLDIPAAPSAMEVEPAPPKESVLDEKKPATTVKPKKKKKKASYKSMMAGMMQGSQNERDIEKEKEKLREVTGGGAFTKIDKI